MQTFSQKIKQKLLKEDQVKLISMKDEKEGYNEENKKHILTRENIFGKSQTERMKKIKSKIALEHNEDKDAVYNEYDKKNPKFTKLLCIQNISINSIEYSLKKKRRKDKLSSYILKNNRKFSPTVNDSVKIFDDSENCKYISQRDSDYIIKYPGSQEHNHLGSKANNNIIAQTMIPFHFIKRNNSINTNTSKHPIPFIMGSSFLNESKEYINEYYFNNHHNLQKVKSAKRISNFINSNESSLNIEPTHKRNKSYSGGKVEFRKELERYEYIKKFKINEVKRIQCIWRGYDLRKELIDFIKIAYKVTKVAIVVKKALKTKAFNLLRRKINLMLAEKKKRERNIQREINPLKIKFHSLKENKFLQMQKSKNFKGINYFNKKIDFLKFQTHIEVKEGKKVEQIDINNNNNEQSKEKEFYNKKNQQNLKINIPQVIIKNVKANKINSLNQGNIIDRDDKYCICKEENFGIITKSFEIKIKYNDIKQKLQLISIKNNEHLSISKEYSLLINDHIKKKENIILQFEKVKQNELTIESCDIKVNKELRYSISSLENEKEMFNEESDNFSEGVKLDFNKYYYTSKEIKGVKDQKTKSISSSTIEETGNNITKSLKSKKIDRTTLSMCNENKIDIQCQFKENTIKDCKEEKEEMYISNERSQYFERLSNIKEFKIENQKDLQIWKLYNNLKEKSKKNKIDNDENINYYNIKEKIDWYNKDSIKINSNISFQLNRNDISRNKIWEGKLTIDNCNLEIFENYPISQQSKIDDSPKKFKKNIYTQREINFSIYNSTFNSSKLEQHLDLISFSIKPSRISSFKSIVPSKNTSFTNIPYNHSKINFDFQKSTPFDIFYNHNPNIRILKIIKELKPSRENEISFNNIQKEKSIKEKDIIISSKVNDITIIPISSTSHDKDEEGNFNYTNLSKLTQMYGKFICKTDSSNDSHYDINKTNKSITSLKENYLITLTAITFSFEIIKNKWIDYSYEEEEKDKELSDTFFKRNINQDSILSHSHSFEFINIIPINERLKQQHKTKMQKREIKSIIKNTQKQLIHNNFSKWRNETFIKRKNKYNYLSIINQYSITFYGIKHLHTNKAKLPEDKKISFIKQLLLKRMKINYIIVLQKYFPKFKKEKERINLHFSSPMVIKQRAGSYINFKEKGMKERTNSSSSIGKQITIIRNFSTAEKSIKDYKKMKVIKRKMDDEHKKSLTSIFNLQEPYISKKRKGNSFLMLNLKKYYDKWKILSNQYRAENFYIIHLIKRKREGKEFGNISRSFLQFSFLKWCYIVRNVSYTLILKMDL